MSNGYKRSLRLKKGITFFLKSNIILLILMLLLLTNTFSWKEDRIGLIVMMLASAELYILLLSILTIIIPRETNKKKIERFSKSEWIGLLLVIIFISIFSLVFTGAELPFPSTIIMLILVMNSMIAFFSLVFHKLSIILYEANVYPENDSITNYIFKYIAIVFSGLNYYVQSILDRMPLLINKLLAIVFLLLLIWENMLLLFYFE
ncbi:hypothetical protein QNH47_00895 [Virgibacillus halodenitrificans]|uniref:hypothetical protein n=1 Tax=Virgibacillus halodenitrificans TaxID=1482 RepID=UPI0024BF9A8D|nr:hypothetical protein [Virgibacillus halodenitrificans]WHX26441.1 hypothetical protein QNH47_00895 [Virgibacillus halodenitrificans]